MRYGVIPGWVNVMLVVMGLGFIGGGAAFLLFAPPPVGAIVGGIWLVVGLGMAFFAARAIKGRQDDERIRREGTAATATLLGADTTGWFINGLPQWKLRLRIDGAGASYETTLKMLTFSPPMSGASFSVRIDPARREHVVLAGDQPSSSAGGAATGDDTTTATIGGGDATQDEGGARDPAETIRLLADLERMRASGALGQSEFDAIKAKLLGES
jgi:hypothetical protein